jgi:hypothetical protein
MTRALCPLVAAALAGCAGSTPTPADTRSETDRPLYRTEASQPSPAKGDAALGSAFGPEWRARGEPQTTTPPTGAARDSLTAEEREFEDWRAWQEWKRKNPK